MLKQNAGHRFISSKVIIPLVNNSVLARVTAAASTAVAQNPAAGHTLRVFNAVQSMVTRPAMRVPVACRAARFYSLPR